VLFRVFDRGKGQRIVSLGRGPSLSPLGAKRIEALDVLDEVRSDGILGLECNDADHVRRAPHQKAPKVEEPTVRNVGLIDVSGQHNLGAVPGPADNVDEVFCSTRCWDSSTSRNVFTKSRPRM
jgi:hypothetical protein